jgi:hypothetical protein
MIENVDERMVMVHRHVLPEHCQQRFHTPRLDLRPEPRLKANGLSNRRLRTDRKLGTGPGWSGLRRHGLHERHRAAVAHIVVDSQPPSATTVATATLRTLAANLH